MTRTFTPKIKRDDLDSRCLTPLNDDAFDTRVRLELDEHDTTAWLTWWDLNEIDVALTVVDQLTGHEVTLELESETCQTPTVRRTVLSGA